MASMKLVAIGLILLTMTVFLAGCGEDTTVTYEEQQQDICESDSDCAPTETCSDGECVAESGSTGVR